MKTITFAVLILATQPLAAGTTNNFTQTHPDHTSKGETRPQKHHRKPGHPPKKTVRARSPRHTSAL